MHTVLSRPFLRQHLRQVARAIHGWFPSHDIDFNAGNRFKWHEGENEAKDINLLFQLGRQKQSPQHARLRNVRQIAPGCSRTGRFRCVCKATAFFTRLPTWWKTVMIVISNASVSTRTARYTKFMMPTPAARMVSGEKSASKRATLISLLLTLASQRPRPRRNDAVMCDNVDIAATINYLAVASSSTVAPIKGTGTLSLSRQ